MFGCLHRRPSPASTQPPGPAARPAGPRRAAGDTARRPAWPSPARTRSSGPGTATAPARSTPSAAPAAAAAAAPASPSPQRPHRPAPAGTPWSAPRSKSGPAATRPATDPQHHHEPQNGYVTTSTLRQGHWAHGQDANRRYSAIRNSATQCSCHAQRLRQASWPRGFECVEPIPQSGSVAASTGQRNARSVTINVITAATRVRNARGTTIRCSRVLAMACRSSADALIFPVAADVSLSSLSARSCTLPGSRPSFRAEGLRLGQIRGTDRGTPGMHADRPRNSSDLPRSLLRLTPQLPRQVRRRSGIYRGQGQLARVGVATNAAGVGQHDP